MSPTLGIPIGTAYVPPASAAEGSPLEIEIRGPRYHSVFQNGPITLGDEMGAGQVLSAVGRLYARRSAPLRTARRRMPAWLWPAMESTTVVLP